MLGHRAEECGGLERGRRAGIVGTSEGIVAFQASANHLGMSTVPVRTSQES